MSLVWASIAYGRWVLGLVVNLKLIDVLTLFEVRVTRKIGDGMAASHKL